MIAAPIRVTTGTGARCNAANMIMEIPIVVMMFR